MVPERKCPCGIGAEFKESKAKESGCLMEHPLVDWSGRAGSGGEVAEDPEEAAGKQGCCGEGEDPGHGDRAEG